MLLAEGHVVYYGPSAAVVPWFAALGFAMPYGVNVADFLLDLAQGEVEGGGGSSTLHLLPADGSAAAAAAAADGSSSDDTAAAGDVKQQHVQLVPGTAAAGAAVVPGDLVLSGPAAVRALYSSYKHFAAVHKQGFDGEHQLQV